MLLKGNSLLCTVLDINKTLFMTTARQQLNPYNQADSIIMGTVCWQVLSRAISSVYYRIK